MEEDRLKAVLFWGRLTATYGMEYVNGLGEQRYACLDADS